MCIPLHLEEELLHKGILLGWCSSYWWPFSPPLTCFWFDDACDEVGNRWLWFEGPLLQGPLLTFLGVYLHHQHSFWTDASFIQRFDLLSRFWPQILIFQGVWTPKMLSWTSYLLSLGFFLVLYWWTRLFPRRKLKHFFNSILHEVAYGYSIVFYRRCQSVDHFLQGWRGQRILDPFTSK